MAAVGERRARSPTRVFFMPPSRHLLCSLCDDHFNEVVLPCAGGHTFCRECVLRWFERQRTCPEFRAAVPANAALLPNRVVMATVDELRVRCRFGVKEEGDGWVPDEAGCSAQLSLDGAAAHEATCSFATITCPFAGCGVQLRRSDVASHNSASVQAHLDGERAARLAGEATVAAISSRLEVSTAAATSRIAALEARVFCASATPPVAPMLSDGWAVRHTIQAADDEEDPIIWCCAFSPDSRSVCIGMNDYTLKLFDVATGDHRLTLEGHEGSVIGCTFSPDGSTIVSASDDKTLKLWNAASGVVIRTLEGHRNEVWCCAFSPDGRSICSGSVDKSLKLWDAATGDDQRTLDGHTSFVSCCVFSADATVLSGSYDKTLKLWSVATGACIRTFTGHTDGVLACCFSPTDGNTILSGSGDETLKLCDATIGVCRRTLSGHTSSVWGCAFSPIHGNLVLSSSADKRLKLWDGATGACTATLEEHEGEVYRCSISPDGATIASGDEWGQLKLWRRA